MIYKIKTMKKIFYYLFVLCSISGYAQNIHIDTSNINIINIQEVLFPQLKVEGRDIFTATEYCNLGEYDIEGFRMPRLYLDFRAGVTTQIDSGERFGFWQIHFNLSLAIKESDYVWVTIGYDELDRFINVLKYINDNMVSLPSGNMPPSECFYATKNKSLVISVTNTFDKSWVMSINRWRVKVKKEDMDYLIAVFTSAKSFIDRKL